MRILQITNIRINVIRGIRIYSLFMNKIIGKFVFYYLAKWANALFDSAMR